MLDSLALFIAIVLAFGGSLLYWLKLRQAIRSAPQLLPRQGELSVPEGAISVIVPAYNEAANIQECLTSILASTLLSADRLEVWAVDDQSTDETLAIIESLQQRLADPRFKVLAGQPKPKGQTWVGKNWACTQAAERSNGDFLLFVDADVRLQKGAIETTVQEMEEAAIDLLSLGPAIVCGCLAEWLVQPLIINTILVGYDFAAVNDPDTDAAFAAGPFMLFRRSAYEQIGGHRAVASQIVEDVELARLIKFDKLQLRYVTGTQLASLRMYRSWAALWEGWTKNLYLGSQRNIRGMIYFITMILLVCTVPWLGLLVLLVKALLMPLSSWDEGSIALCLTMIVIQYDLRRSSESVTQISPRYWWLTGVGGILVAAIAIGSIIKTETGWGWTWRGRSLTLPES